MQFTLEKKTVIRGIKLMHSGKSTYTLQPALCVHSSSIFSVLHLWNQPTSGHVLL